MTTKNIARPSVSLLTFYNHIHMISSTMINTDNNIGDENGRSGDKEDVEEKNFNLTVAEVGSKDVERRIEKLVY